MLLFADDLFAMCAIMRLFEPSVQPQVAMPVSEAARGHEATLVAVVDVFGLILLFGFVEETLTSELGLFVLFLGVPLQ